MNKYNVQFQIESDLDMVTLHKGLEIFIGLLKESTSNVKLEANKQLKFKNNIKGL